MSMKPRKKVEEWKTAMKNSDSILHPSYLDYSDFVINHRAEIYSRLDNFCTFSWGGYDSFDIFGAFIVNEDRSGIKFNTASNFSNEYSKAQFDSATHQLLGINYNVKSFSFKVCLYYITEKDIRAFMEWINPHLIDNLSFSYETDFRYICKIASISESNRYQIGTEIKVLDNGEKSYIPYFVTEMDLTFDIQGEAAAYSQENIAYFSERLSSDTNIIKFAENESDTKYTASDLPMDFKIAFPIYLNHIISDFADIRLFISYKNNDQIQDFLLGEVIFKNFKNSMGSYILTPTTLDSKEVKDVWKKRGQSTGVYTIDKQVNEESKLYLEYESKTGLFFLITGSNKILISLNAINGEGDKIIHNFIGYKYKLPGKLTDYVLNYNNFNIKITINGTIANIIPASEVILSGYKKTNII